MNQVYEDEREELRRRERAAKIARAKAEKERQLRRRKLIKKLFIPAMGLILVIVLVIIILTKVISSKAAEDKDQTEYTTEQQTQEQVVIPTPTPEPTPEVKEYHYTEAADMAYMGSDDMTSSNAILVNLSTGEIVGQKDYQARIVPASMTKVLTALVAAENVDDFQDKVTVTYEATNWSYVNDCSAVGFEVDEVVTVEDLFYGTILSSGGDAAYQLAMYVAGSEEAFVDMMNAKLEELGIADTTHFTNCAGIYDENHYSTCYDMAVIMNAALDNDYVREVLHAHKYTTSATEQHPEGLLISNWFLRRIEDFDTGGEVYGAKTGFVDESGCCAVSYSIQNDGSEYIAVTCDAHSNWRCIYDHIDIYSNFTNASTEPHSLSADEQETVDDEISD